MKRFLLGMVGLIACGVLLSGQVKVNSGVLGTSVMQVPITFANFSGCTDALTCDVTVATFPAKTFLIHALADKTTAFTCATSCDSGIDLSVTLGTSAGGNQLLLSFDADAAAAVYGDAANELGAAVAPASMPTILGTLGSWTAATTVSLRMTSASGNIHTHLNAGAVTFYLTTVRF